MFHARDVFSEREPDSPLVCKKPSCFNVYFKCYFYLADNFIAQVFFLLFFFVFVFVFVGGDGGGRGAIHK